MPVSITCPKCGATGSVPEKSRGRFCRCPKFKYEGDGVCYVYRRVEDRTIQVCVEYKKTVDAFVWIEADRAAYRHK
jgi:hypothetical protein